MNGTQISFRAKLGLQLQSKRLIVFAIAFATLQLAVGLLLLANESTSSLELYLPDWFPINAITSLWLIANFPSVIFGIIISGNVHQPNEIAVYIGSWIQWFIISFLISSRIKAFAMKKHERKETVEGH